MVNSYTIQKRIFPNQETKGPNANWQVNVLIMIITVVISSFFFSFHFNKQKKEIIHYNVVVGNIWSKDAVKADFSFPVFKDERVFLKELNEAKKNSLPVFLFNEQAEKSAYDFLDNLMKYIKKSNPVYSESLKELVKESSVQALVSSQTEDFTKSYKNIDKLFHNFLKNIYKYGISDKELSSFNNAELALRIDINTDKIFPKAQVIDPKSFQEKAKNLLEEKVEERYIPFVREVIQKLYKPNFIYSSNLTDKARELSVQAVAKTEGIVREGETIINKGERVSESTIQKLTSYQHSKYIKNDTDNSFVNVLGSVGHAGFIYSILIIYLIILRKRILTDNFNFGLLSCLLILVSLFTWLSIQIPSKYPLEYLIIVPGISMLVAILFDSRTAFYFTVTISLMVTGIRGNDYDTGTALMFAGILGAYTVRDIQSRTQIFKSIFFIALGFFVTIISFGFERSIDFDQTLSKLIVAFVNSALSPIITFGLLFVLERMTNVTTDLRLEEYNNLNSPLIVKMSELAPGTYQHTLQLAVLAEKCASAIGANRLLARVGALYHDIGKITKPEYFVENQLEMDNKHNLISPKKSAEAIRGHVTEGMKIAKEYKLPQKIADFIPMHHGTFLIKHFYAKALEEAHGEEINESDYRYPGPKPTTKEAAIVMICDSAEAISRLAANDKEELDKSIDRTINSRLQDGQFDDCDITFKDLHIIKEICVKNLFGIAHQRVEYKEIPDTQGKVN